MPRDRRRVRFQGSNQKLDGIYSWQCDPDGKMVRPKEADGEAYQGINTGDLHHMFKDATLRLRSMDGDLYEVEGTLLQRSPLIQQLAIDGELDDEIPLPGTTSRGLANFLELCHRAKSASSSAGGCLVVPEKERPETLCEILWVIKLLHMGREVGGALADLIVSTTFGSKPFWGMPSDPLTMILHDGGSRLTPQLLIELIGIVVYDVNPNLTHAVVTTLATYLGHLEEAVRQAAVEGLQAIGTIDASLVLMKHKNISIRMGAVRAVPRGSHEDVKPVVKLTADVSFQVREAAARALGRVAPVGDQAALKCLVGLLEDAVRDVREAAIDSVGKVAIPNDPDAVGLVTRLASHEDWPVRCAAIRVLADILPDNQDMVRSLAEEIKDLGHTMAKMSGSRLLKTLNVPPPNEDDDDSDEDEHKACSQNGYSTGSLGSDPQKFKPRWTEVHD